MLNFTYSIFISILLLSQFSFAQKIEPGKYVYEYGDNYFSIFDFINDSTFYLEEKTWNDHIIAFGNYYLENSSLVLKFRDVPNEKFVLLNSAINKINSESFSNKNYLKIKIKVTESWQNEPIESGLIIILDSNENLMRSDILTDSDGFAEFKVSKRFLPIKITINSVGYARSIIDINELRNYDISVILKDRVRDIFNENEIKKYKIQILDSSRFKIKNNYEYFDWSIFIKNK